MAAVDLALGVAVGGSAATSAVACSHCGLDVPAGFVEPGAERQFCCSGCRTAFAILAENGLDAYYAFSEKREQPVRSTGRSYDEFDHPAFRALHVRDSGDGFSRVELYLEGVHCASCVWLVERVPLLIAGVARAELDVRRSLATVVWDAGAVPLSRIARTLDSLGYAPHPFRGLKRELVRRKEDRAALVRIGVAGAIAVNVMLAALALYSGHANGMEQQYEQFFRWISFALAIPALAFPGRGFFTGAIAALRTRTLHMDLPIAVGLAAGFVRGAINTVTATGPVYFDGLCTLVFVLLVGRYLQLRGQRAAADSAELLSSLTPHTARVVEPDGTSREVPAEALLPGMTLDVRAGESLPADGEVVAGESAVNLALLTGESRPVTVAIGAAVFAGTLNVSAPLRVRVTGAGEDSRVARMLRQVEESSARKAPVVLLADRLSGAFVAVVLVVAVAIYAYWLQRDPSRATDNAIALLIVTCPCALAMATPLAVTVALGRAAREGIFIKGGQAVELLSKPGQLFLDKTGTLTEGRTSVVTWDGPEWVKPFVAALERESSHPIADGFRRAWPFELADLPVVSRSEHVVGGGIIGTVGGHEVVVGSPAFVTRQVAASVPDSLAARSEALTPVLVAVDGAIVARAGLGDPLRADARAAVEALAARGWKISILSGDATPVVRDAASRLGISAEACHGEMSPEGKLAVVEAARRRGPVVMVGDGVNDAGAIAAASVGIGAHGGAEACLATADVYLTTPGLNALVQLADGSARTMRTIRRNITFSLLYNVAGAALAITGVISPLIAAIMMPASSLTVILSSWRGRFTT